MSRYRTRHNHANQHEGQVDSEAEESTHKRLRDASSDSEGDVYVRARGRGHRLVDSDEEEELNAPPRSASPVPGATPPTKEKTTSGALKTAPSTTSSRKAKDSKLGTDEDAQKSETQTSAKVLTSNKTTSTKNNSPGEVKQTNVVYWGKTAIGGTDRSLVTLSHDFQSLAVGWYAGQPVRGGVYYASVSSGGVQRDAVLHPNPAFTVAPLPNSVFQHGGGFKSTYVSFIGFVRDVNEGGTNNNGTYMRRIEVAVRTAEDRAVTAKIFLFEDQARDFSAKAGDLLVFGNLARKGSENNLVFWAGASSYVAKAFVGPNNKSFATKQMKELAVWLAERPVTDVGGEVTELPALHVPVLAEDLLEAQ